MTHDARVPVTVEDRAERTFWSKVDKRGPGECWLWTGKLDDGYGGSYYQGKRMKAHRVSAFRAGLPVEPGMHVDHMCRNRACVNPAHLRVVTARVNALENSEAPPALNAKKTHCKRGHPLSGSNLTSGHLLRGQRACRQCLWDWKRAKRQRIAAEKAAAAAIRKRGK